MNDISLKCSELLLFCREKKEAKRELRDKKFNFSCETFCPIKMKLENPTKL